jgi:hypothetical protein
MSKPDANPDSATVAARVAHLPHMSMNQLWALWDDHFDERPGHHQRVWLESRLAYRMQERAFGGLKPSVRKQLEDIGETGLLPRAMRRDANRLHPGTMLSRVFDDIEHRVLVRGPNDFEYEGRRYTSLTAIACHISGTRWSGPAFFGLTAKERA